MTDKGIRAETVKSADDTSNKKILVQNLEKELREIINNKKFQVDINTLKTDNGEFGFSISLNGQDEVEFESYLQYLLSDNALGTPRAEGSGTSSVLATDIEVSENNTIYFDTGLKFSQLGSAENGPLGLKESIGSIMPGTRGDATPTAPATDTYEQLSESEKFDLGAYIVNLQTLNNGDMEKSVFRWLEAVKGQDPTLSRGSFNNMLDQVLTNKLMKKDADGVIEYTRSLGNKWFDTIEQPSPQIVTQPAPVVPKVIDITEQPAENSTADVLKDTESISNDISSSIFGTAPVVETTPGPKVISGSLFATKEVAEAKGLTDKQLAQGDKLNEQYQADPNAPQEAQDLATICKGFKKQ
jgi:hypothetical protein